MPLLEEKEKEMEVLFATLTINAEDTDITKEEGKRKNMERLLNRIHRDVEAIHSICDAAFPLKLEATDLNTAKEWKSEVFSPLKVFENAEDEIVHHINKIKEEELRLEEIRIKLQKHYNEESNQSTGAKTENTSEAKLPKVVITRFNGSHLDWIRFWNQFEAEIDNANISPVTKFSYLKEMLIPSVRIFIDGLPFTTEGFQRAKNIFKSKYGKNSEIVTAHIQQIMQLPVLG